MSYGVAELTGRRSGSKQQQVAEDKTITAAAPAASTAPATAAIKRSTRSMRAKGKLCDG